MIVNTIWIFSKYLTIFCKRLLLKLECFAFCGCFEMLWSRQRIKVGHSFSTLLPVSNGVPQTPYCRCKCTPKWTLLMNHMYAETYSCARRYNSHMFCTYTIYTNIPSCEIIMTCMYADTKWEHNLINTNITCMLKYNFTYPTTVYWHICIRCFKYNFICTPKCFIHLWCADVRR